MKGRILAAFAVVYLVWGSTYLAIRVAVATLPPFLLAGTRFVAAGLLLYAWARVRGAPAPGRREWLASLAIGILLVAGANAVVGWAEQQVSSGLAALIVAGMPLWVALFQRLGPDTKPLGAARVAGLLLGFAGLVVLLSGGGAAGAAGACPGGLAACLGKHASPATIPMLALVGASMSWALGSVLSRRVPLPADKTLASAMSMLAGGVVTLGVGAAAGELAAFDAARVSAVSVAAWAYLVVFGSMLGFTCFTWLVSVVDPTRVATYAYVNPVVALFLGWWLAGEPLGARTLVAAPIILVGLVLVLRPEALPLPRRRPRAEVAA